MAGNRQKKRYDSNRRILKTGESQRANGSYSYRWKDENGDRQEVYAKTLDALREKEKEIQQDALNGISTRGKNKTVKELYETWKNLKRGIRGTTADSYYALYMNHIKPAFEQKKVSTIKKSDVKAFYIRLHEEEELKMKTIEGIHNVFRQIMNIAVDDKYISSNPTHGALSEVKKANRGKKKQRLALTVDQQERLLTFVAESRVYQRWYPIIVVMLGTGMRVGEVTGLCWDDIDWERNLIDVKHTLVYESYRDLSGNRKWRHRIHAPKTMTSRRLIPMINQVRDALQEERENQTLLNLKCRIDIDGYNNFIFLTQRGTPERENYLNKTLRRIVRDANKEVTEGLTEAPELPEFTCHNLRHTFATRLIEAGVNVKVVQDLMGHADAEMTLNVYTDVKLEFKVQELKSFEKAASVLGYTQKKTADQFTPNRTPMIPFPA